MEVALRLAMCEYYLANSASRLIICMATLCGVAVFCFGLFAS